MTTAMKSTELANLAKLICYIYITNGHVGIQIKCDVPIDGCNLNAEWVATLKPQLEPGEPIDIEIPGIKPRDSWKEPFKQIESICSECDGDGLIECNLGHEHECEFCEGTGKSTSDWAGEYYSLGVDQTQYQIPGVGWYDCRYLWVISEIQKHADLVFSMREDRWGINTLLFAGDGIKGVLMGIQRR